MDFDNTSDPDKQQVRPILLVVWLWNQLECDGCFPEFYEQDFESITKAN
jgi:hypothetical protein